MTIGRGGSTSVRFFEQLYAIVVGLGLAVAAEQVIDLEKEIPIAWGEVPLFFAYLNIGFALAHSSIRYMELAYEDRALGRLGKGRVIWDISLGVGHFLFLIGLSFVISRPLVFIYFAIVLLLGRPLRDGILRMAGRERLEFDDKVATIHIITIVFLAAILVVSGLTGGSTESATVKVAVLAASLLYGLGLYLTAFEYFFGGPETVGGASESRGDQT